MSHLRQTLVGRMQQGKHRFPNNLFVSPATKSKVWFGLRFFWFFWCQLSSWIRTDYWFNSLLDIKPMTVENHPMTKNLMDDQSKPCHPCFSLDSRFIRPVFSPLLIWLEFLESFEIVVYCTWVSCLICFCWQAMWYKTNPPGCLSPVSAG